MMTPALPPSSRTTFFFPHFSLSRHPTAALPVKLKSLKRGSTTNRSAIWFSHGSTLSPPGGTPASNATSPSNKAVNGVCGAGLIRIGLPCGQSRRNLVGDEIQREIERRNAQNRGRWESGAGCRDGNLFQASSPEG